MNLAVSTITAMAHGLSGEHLFKGATDGGQNVFEIPEYQRPYVWKKDNWEALFSDLTDNDAGYFVGAIICADKSSTTTAYTRYDVVDGQQRLTTLSIFLAAIYNELETRRKILKEKLDTEFDDFWDEHSARFSQIKRSLTVKTSDGKFRTRVLPQNEDNLNDYFNILIESGLIKEVTLDYNRPIGKKDGRHLIPRAYEYFKKSVAEYAEGDKGQYKNNMTEQVTKIMEILSKINSSVLVMIKADSHSSANTLFEALNNRGEPLTITDLVKNRLFSNLKEKHTSNFEKYRSYWEEEIWKKVFISDEKEIPGGEQERFFRHSYNAFRTDWIKDYPSESFAIGKRANLYESYDKMISLDSLRVFEQIRECAKIYPRLQGEEAIGLSTSLHEAYNDLGRINGATSYTLLLYLVKNRKSLNLTDKDFEKICRLLISFFVRRSFTDDPPANRLDAIFIGYIDEIERNNYIGDTICEKLAIWLKEEYMADANDEKFKAQLRGDVYDKKGTNSAIRFVLVKLAESYLGKINVDFWEKARTDKHKKEVYIWSIEHIMPQTLSTEWKKRLASADSEAAEKICADNVNKLGNLTLTTYNAELSNRLFFHKQNTKAVGYKDDILAKGLNSYVCQQEEWGAPQIQTRTELLIEEILKVFKW